jgi:hypothetical protein
MIHSAAQPPRVVLRHARRAENSPKTAVSPAMWTVQRAPDVRVRRCHFHPPPAGKGVVDRGADVLVLMLVHPPTYSSTAGSGRKWTNTALPPPVAADAKRQNYLCGPPTVVVSPHPWRRFAGVAQKLLLKPPRSSATDMDVRMFCIEELSACGYDRRRQTARFVPWHLESIRPFRHGFGPTRNRLDRRRACRFLHAAVLSATLHPWVLVRLRRDRSS